MPLYRLASCEYRVVCLNVSAQQTEVATESVLRPRVTGTKMDPSCRPDIRCNYCIVDVTGHDVPALML